MAGGANRRAQIDTALEHRGIDPAGPMSRYQLKEMIRIIELMGGRLSVGAFADVDGTRASYDTAADQGADGGLVFSAGAAAPNAAGNNLSIAYADTATAGSETVDWAVDADGAIECTIGIESGVSLASEVVTALEADAGTLLDVAISEGEDGTGVVITMAAKALTGGEAPTGAFVITPEA